MHGFKVRRKKHTDFICAAIFLLFAAQIICAEILPIKNYTAADGLGSSSISCLASDSRGFSPARI